MEPAVVRDEAYVQAFRDAWHGLFDCDYRRLVKGLNSVRFQHKHLNDMMIWAADSGQTNAVKRLLQHGADVHDQYDFALRRAALKGHTSTVRFLLKEGHANVHAHNDEAFAFARIKGHVETVGCILFYGAPPPTSSEGISVKEEHWEAMHRHAIWEEQEQIRELQRQTVIRWAVATRAMDRDQRMRVVRAVR